MAAFEQVAPEYSYFTPLVFLPTGIVSISLDWKTVIITGAHHVTTDFDKQNDGTLPLTWFWPNGNKRQAASNVGASRTR